MTLNSFADLRWFPRACVAPYCSPSTAVTRRAAYENWLRHGLGKLQIRGIKRRDLEKLRAGLLEDGCAPGTVAFVMDSTLRSLWKYARLIGVVSHNPFVGLPTLPRVPSQPDPFVVEEAQALMAHFRKAHDGQFGLFVESAFLTGARPSELCALTAGHVNIERRSISIESGLVNRMVTNGKTARSRRTIAVPQMLADHLAEELPADPREYLFTMRDGRPIMSAIWGSYYWKLACEKLGLRPRKFYATRASYISWTLSAGGSVVGVAQHCGTSVRKISEHYARWMPPRDADPLTLALGHQPSTVSHFFTLSRLTTAGKPCGTRASERSADRFQVNDQGSSYDVTPEVRA